MSGERYTKAVSVHLEEEHWRMLEHMRGNVPMGAYCRGVIVRALASEVGQGSLPIEAPPAGMPKRAAHLVVDLTPVAAALAEHGEALTEIIEITHRYGQMLVEHLGREKAAAASDAGARLKLNWLSRHQRGGSAA